MMIERKPNLCGLNVAIPIKQGYTLPRELDKDTAPRLVRSTLSRLSAFPKANQTD